MATFQAEAEDREWDDGDEIESDDDRANDWAFDGLDQFGFPDDGEKEPDYLNAPMPPDSEAADTILERKRGQAIEDRRDEEPLGPGAVYVTKWHDREYRSLRPHGKDEVGRMRRAVRTPSRDGRWR